MSAVNNAPKLSPPPKLGTRAHFLRVQNAGRRYKDRHLVVIAAPGQGRVGYTVSRKVGNAVVRNRVRRRLREIFRTHPQSTKATHDYVVIAMPPCATSTFDALQRELLRLLARVV